MALHLTPDMLSSAYDLLRTTPPFRGWRLPPADEVVFTVSASDDRLGDYRLDKQRHHIRISVKGVSQLDTLVRVMAHEMVHLYQQMKGLHNKNQHNADFRRRTKLVCRVHGNFDPALFC